MNRSIKDVDIDNVSDISDLDLIEDVEGQAHREEQEEQEEQEVVDESNLQIYIPDISVDIQQQAYEFGLDPYKLKDILDESISLSKPKEVNSTKKKQLPTVYDDWNESIEINLEVQKAELWNKIVNMELKTEKDAINRSILTSQLDSVNEELDNLIKLKKEILSKKKI